MNQFDAVVYLFTFVAVIIGFNAGLLRSLATIFSYLCAAPVAVGAAPYASRILNDQFHLPPAQNWLVPLGLFLAVGMALSALLRLTVGELAGTRIGIPDRLAGAVLGAVRTGLLAVLMVVIFDRIIPPGREAAFLAGSQLRPLLSNVGRAGLQSLPPEVADSIDRLKKERGI